MTDVAPDVTAPTLFNYALCGQWPGPVAERATLSLRCTSKHLCHSLLSLRCTSKHLCHSLLTCGVPQNTCITNYTCVTVYSPAVYLKHASVQIRHRTVPDHRVCKHLRTGGLRSLKVALSTNYWSDILMSKPQLFYTKLENVTIANALQLEAARATSSLSMPSLTSLNLSIAVL